MSIWRCLFTHKWSSWSQIYRVGDNLVQFRHCKRCNRADDRIVKGEK